MRENSSLTTTTTTCPLTLANSTWPERLGWQSQQNDDNADGEKWLHRNNAQTCLVSQADTGKKQYPLLALSVRGPQLNHGNV